MTFCVSRLVTAVVGLVRCIARKPVLEFSILCMFGTVVSVVVTCACLVWTTATCEVATVSVDGDSVVLVVVMSGAGSGQGVTR